MNGEEEEVIAGGIDLASISSSKAPLLHIIVSELVRGKGLEMILEESKTPS